MNLQELTDEQLDQHRQEVLSEQERRQALATIPNQIRELTARFLEGGGDPEKLV